MFLESVFFFSLQTGNGILETGTLFLHLVDLLFRLFVDRLQFAVEVCLGFVIFGLAYFKTLVGGLLFFVVLVSDRDDLPVERICDGLYLANSLTLLKRMLRNPALLEEPLDAIVEDIK